MRFPSLKGFDFGLDVLVVGSIIGLILVSIPQRVRLRPRQVDFEEPFIGTLEFPSLKGFDFGLDKFVTNHPYWSVVMFPSLKGFDFGLDKPARVSVSTPGVRFHPSKGSTSA